MAERLLFHEWVRYVIFEVSILANKFSSPIQYILQYLFNHMGMSHPKIVAFYTWTCRYFPIGDEIWLNYMYKHLYAYYTMSICFY